MASVRKSYISKSVNNRKLVPAVKFENFTAYHKESIRKLVSLISANIFIKNNIYMTFGFKFQKNSIQILWIFGFNILVRLWVKAFVSQG